MNSYTKSYNIGYLSIDDRLKGNDSSLQSQTGFYNTPNQEGNNRQIAFKLKLFPKLILI